MPLNKSKTISHLDLIGFSGKFTTHLRTDVKGTNSAQSRIQQASSGDVAMLSRLFDTLVLDKSGIENLLSQINQAAHLEDIITPIIDEAKTLFFDTKQNTLSPAFITLIDELNYRKMLTNTSWQNSNIEAQEQELAAKVLSSVIVLLAQELSVIAGQNSQARGDKLNILNIKLNRLKASLPRNTVSQPLSEPSQIRPENINDKCDAFSATLDTCFSDGVSIEFQHHVLEEVTSFIDLSHEINNKSIQQISSRLITPLNNMAKTVASGQSITPVVKQNESQIEALLVHCISLKHLVDEQLKIAKDRQLSRSSDSLPKKQNLIQRWFSTPQIKTPEPKKTVPITNKELCSQLSVMDGQLDTIISCPELMEGIENSIIEEKMKDELKKIISIINSSQFSNVAQLIHQESVIALEAMIKPSPFADITSASELINLLLDCDIKTFQEYLLDTTLNNLFQTHIELATLISPPVSLLHFYVHLTQDKFNILLNINSFQHFFINLPNNLDEIISYINSLTCNALELALQSDRLQDIVIKVISESDSPINLLNKFSQPAFKALIDSKKINNPINSLLTNDEHFTNAINRLEQGKLSESFRALPTLKQYLSQPTQLLNKANAQNIDNLYKSPVIKQTIAALFTANTNTTKLVEFINALGNQDNEISLNHFTNELFSLSNDIPNLCNIYQSLNDSGRKAIQHAISHVELIIETQRYLDKRQSNENIYTHFGSNVFGNFFGGYKRQEKIEATQALQQALINTETNLSDHKGALRNGELGKTIRSLLKKGNVTIAEKQINTVSELIDSLFPSKPPAVKQPRRING